MPLPVLTWNIATEQVIAVTTPTYAEFLNKIETMITASTHWRVNNKTLDAVNSRGFIELAPKSALAGVVDGRVLLLFSTGTVAGSAGTERPLVATRNAPWASATSTLQCKMWTGVSPNAASTSGGPTNDPWTSATPYGAAQWTKLFPLHATLPEANGVVGLIESAEGFCLYWRTSTGSVTQYLLGGRMLERVDGENADWYVGGAYTAGDTAAAAAAWNSVLHITDYFPPFGSSQHQSSGGSATRSWGAALIDGNLNGAGRIDSGGAAQVLGGLSSINYALFRSIPLAGGIYGVASQDSLLGTLRQVRWGPAAYSGQRLYDGSGVVQGINFNYAVASAGAKPWGLWFDNFR